jgi:hypothetical protein
MTDASPPLAGWVKHVLNKNYPPRSISFLKKSEFYKRHGDPGMNGWLAL